MTEEFKNPIIDELVGSDSYSATGFVFSLTADLGRLLVELIDIYFKNYPNIERDIFAFTSYPSISYEGGYPRIVVSITSGSPSHTFIADNVTYIEDENKVTVTGLFKASIRFTILSRTEAECRQIADELSLGLLYPLRNVLQRWEVILIPNTLSISDMATEVDTPVGELFKIEVSVDAEVNWVHEYSVGDLVTISNVIIKKQT